MLGFCQQRGLPTEGLRLVQRIHSNPLDGMVKNIELEIQVPPGFPAKYYDALIKSAELCAVKKHLENPPHFEITTREVAGAVEVKGLSFGRKQAGIEETGLLMWQSHPEQEIAASLSSSS